MNKYQVGQYVRLQLLPGSITLHHAMIWRITAVSSRYTIHPVFGLFGLNTRCADRAVAENEIELLKIEDMGMEYVQFTEFMQKLAREEG